MQRGLFAQLCGLSVSARVFAAPLMGIAITVAALWAAEKKADMALADVAAIQSEVASRSERAEQLIAVTYLIHSDVSRHLALVGSGLSDAELKAIRDATARNQARAVKLVEELSAALSGEKEKTLVRGIAQRLKSYAGAVDQMNDMAAIDRLIAIPLMSHVDEQFAALNKETAAAQAAVQAAGAAAMAASRADLEAQNRNFALIMGGVLALLLGGGIVLARTITSPLKELTETTVTLASGRTDVHIHAAWMKNEVGAMARALEKFRDDAREVERLKADQERQKVAAEAEKRRALHELADMFETRVGEVARQVGAGAHRVRKNAEGMLTRAEAADRQAGQIAAASQQAGMSVQTAAAATEELSAGIGEIGSQVRRSVDMVAEAVRAVDATDSHVAGLSEAAGKIGEIVNLISSIAAQTNLLALNATIEAARAGDAGKGFAVVAGEVKNLASQTAKATEDISAQIDNMQGATRSAVDAVRTVGGSVVAIEGVIGDISAAMQQQGAATNEIARGVQEAASGAESVSGSITEVSQAAGETGEAANDVLQAARDLDGHATALDTEVKRFISQLRAA
jgi:methyl-accepting chemotaxis protein